MIPTNANEIAVAELLAGAYRDDGGAIWLTSFVEGVLGEGRAELQVAYGASPERDEWNVEVTAGGMSLALIDVRVLTTGNPADLDSHLDSLTAKAVRRWELVTQQGVFGEIRPWLASTLIADAGVERAVESASLQLNTMLRARTLDCVCIAVIDRTSKSVSHPSPFVSIGGMAASLKGRQMQWDVLFGNRS